MAEEDEFTAAPYEQADTGSTADPGGQSLLVNAWCENGDCPNHEQDPAEAAWVKLMSAVPKADQVGSMSTARDDIPLPNDQDINEIVASVRPANARDYALDTIAKDWKGLRPSLIEIRSALKTGLEELANDWTGTDYDAFEEEVSTVLRNFATFVEDIGTSDTDGVIGVLNEKSDAIYAQQGEQAIVYPAPKFWLQDGAACSHKIHIRPPFFETCEVHADDETEHALRMAGFDPEIITEVRDYRQQQYDAYYQENLSVGMTESEAVANADTRAQQDADDYSTNLGTTGTSDYQARAAEVNGEVVTCESIASTEAAALQTDYVPAEETMFTNSDTALHPSGGLDSGSYGGAPDISGTGGTSTMDSPSGLQSLSVGNGTGGGIGLSDGHTVSNTGLDDGNPWNAAGEDPDNVSGGLASGGVGGLSGLGGGSNLGGLGPGGTGLATTGGSLGPSGSGGTALGGPGGRMGGAGGMGGMMGGGGGAGRGGSGATGSRTPRGAGAAGKAAAAAKAGVPKSGVVGGPGAKAGAEEEEESVVSGWLIEDDEVWGASPKNEEDDPYA